MEFIHILPLIWTIILAYYRVANVYRVQVRCQAAIERVSRQESARTLSDDKT